MKKIEVIEVDRIWKDWKDQTWYIVYKVDVGYIKFKIPRILEDNPAISGNNVPKQFRDHFKQEFEQIMKDYLAKEHKIEIVYPK